MIIIPPGKELLPFQVEAVERMLEFTRLAGGCYNACEMGLGKTIQTIATINSQALPYNCYADPILIVCPKVMRLRWKQQMEDWCTVQSDRGGPMRIRVLTKGSDFKDDELATQVYITSYNLLINKISLKWLCKKRFSFMVMDEAHYLKNKKAKRTKAVLGDLWPRARHHYALSGTPFTKDVVDGWTLFSKFAPDDFADFDIFASTYTKARRTPWGMEYKGVKNPEVLRKIMYDKFFVRYKKKDVLKDLPDKTYETVPLGKEFLRSESADEKKLMQEYRKQVQKALASGSDFMPTPPISVMTMRREQGLMKVPGVVEYIEPFMEGGIAVGVFFQHIEALQTFAKEMHAERPAIIYGATSDLEREHAIQRFQNGDTKLFIGQYQAAGVGVDLTAAFHCFLAEHNDSPAIVAQAIDRFHRIGQKNAVQVTSFVVEDSVEVDIVENLIAKAKTFNQII